jgi:hypothetical protein
MSRMKLVTRRSGAVLVVFFSLLLILFVYARIFAGRVKQRETSPDGNSIAEVRALPALSGLDADLIAVRLRTRWNPFRRVVFSGLDYGAQITISWIDPTDLLVTCASCDHLRDQDRENSWRNVTIHYAIR